MPGVTYSSEVVLPVVDRPVLDEPARKVTSLTRAPQGVEGEGFPVKRAFAGVSAEDLDPFIHMDEMGEVDYGPNEPKGTPWHPHRGFETVTYMLDGEFVHRDSNGGGGHLGGGDTQWMTAGAGILHIETPPEQLVVSGGLFHGFQLWVNLPKTQKFVAPRYQDIDHGRVGYGRSADGGTLLRVIAGTVGALSGPGVTYTPMTMVHATVAPEAELAIPWPRDFNGLAYVFAGHALVGSARTPVREAQLAVLKDGAWISLANASTRADLEVLLIGGTPINEPVAWYGPFVMNTHAELAQAFDDYQSGRMGAIPAAHVSK